MHRGHDMPPTEGAVPECREGQDWGPTLSPGTAAGTGWSMLGLGICKAIPTEKNHFPVLFLRRVSHVCVQSLLLGAILLGRAQPARPLCSKGADRWVGCMDVVFDNIQSDLRYKEARVASS